MSSEPRFSGDLDDLEAFWRDHASWLKDRGYQLRPRYQPDWKPSWQAKKSRDRDKYEDAQVAWRVGSLMDALRISDGRMVMIKKFRVDDPTNPTRELQISRLLHSGDLSDEDSHNHCVPVYDIFQLPEDDHVYFIVMPFLTRWWPNWHEVPFSTTGEAIAFVRQLFEGVQFLHSRNFAHNDIKHDNIMVDSAPLYSRLMHPTVSDRRYDWRGTATRKSLTRHPVKYYFIDFDLCKHYDPEAGPAREPPGYGGDRSLPEFKTHPDEPCDPFAVDIFRLGNLIRRFVMTTQRINDDMRRAQVNPSLDFMSGLISDMTQDDPVKRPSIKEVISRFDELVKGLNSFKLRSRFWPGFKRLGESAFIRILLMKAPRHFISQVINVLGRYPAIPPTPPPPKNRKAK
ncbi:kinase-like protein [Dendrothele bispora CBS 962.96]|uniref:Kinase-like protein n=1 Tax=Dendrothele bispora (strain CBS 962.96) TaxID=1314807 RepID=A0A4S8LXR4_DENBC|nr:kinase-like protein [Dendrothele bispora CBS 962.96]